MIKISLIIVAVVIASIALWEKDKPANEVSLTESGLMKTTDLENRYGKILFDKESPFGRVVVGEQAGGDRHLYINYREMCSIKCEQEQCAYSIANITANNIKKDSVVANIGLGCGITAGALATHKNVKSLDVIEINPVVKEAAGEWFKQENSDVLNLKNAKVTIKDGAEYLRTTDKKYDAIVVDIEESTVIYSSPLYTKEYFEIIKSRLNEGGVFSLWSFNANPKFSKVLYNTLKEVFPNVEYRANSIAISYYAAEKTIDIPKDSIAKEVHEDIMNADTKEINTIDDRALERNYDIKKTFGLPDYYKEKFVN